MNPTPGRAARRRSRPGATLARRIGIAGLACIGVLSGSDGVAIADAVSGRTTIATGPWRHDVPPRVGTVLEPQRGLFLCASVSGARYSAETGFLATDCRPLERAGVWRVVACHEDTVSHGSLRRLEVITPDGRTGWIPLPWHDWA